MKCSLAVLFLLFTTHLHASGVVTQIRVDTDVVYFTTSAAKTSTSPACVTAENSAQWTMSLRNETGKAAYALLVTATASDRNVVVETANDCSDVAGYERAASVLLQPKEEESTSGKLRTVGYGKFSINGTSRSCTVFVTENDANSNPYLETKNIATGTYCSCEHDSQQVVTSYRTEGASVKETYLQCVLLTQ